MERILKNHPRALFFGRKNCPHSEKAFHHLQNLPFDVTPVWSQQRAEHLEDKIKDWTGDYIFCFSSLFILPKNYLSKACIAPINFHPASTHYPGSGCLSWALYENAQEHGVTAHIMDEYIDHGPILECRRFPIFPTDNFKTLLEKTLQKKLELFIDITNGITQEGPPFIRKKLALSKNEKWMGSARKIKDIDKLRHAHISDSKEELERIIRATETGDFHPEIDLYGYRFVLKLNDEK